MTTSPEGLRPGDSVGGDFEVVRPLGSGGMGTVYLCRQRSTGRQRAVKVLHPLRAGVAKQRRRFEQEARVGALIDSPHVVEVIGAGVDETHGLPWLAMEYLEGENLADLVHRLGPLARSTTHELLEPVCEALAAAHAAGVVHRDLKPENIFVSYRADDKPLVKLLDFGIANVISEARGSLTGGVGTPRWMAPEQTDLDYHALPASDVWSLGLLAYHLLTAALFWRGDTMAQLMNEIMVAPIPDASTRATLALPPGFDAWFKRCVTRDVDARFETAREAWAALAPLLAGEPHLPVVLTPPKSIARESAGNSTTLSAIADTARASHTMVTPAKPKRRSVAALLVAGAAVAASVAIVVVGRDNRMAPATTPSSSVVAHDAVEVALRTWKQGRFEAARRMLAAQLDKDPTDARAALYLGLDGRPSDATRKHLATALTHEARLSEGERKLLVASNAALSPAPNYETWERSLEALDAAGSHPTFVTITLARVRSYRGDRAGALDALTHAAKVDPEVRPATLAIRGDLERDAHDYEPALTTYRACLSAAPTAAECMAGEAVILAYTGKCDALEHTARAWISTDPEDPRSHNALAVALAATQAPEAAVRAALEAKWAQKATRKPVVQQDRYELAALFGHFDVAIAEAQTAADSVPTSAGPMAHFNSNWLLTLAALEAKQADLVTTTTTAFLQRARAWTPSEPRQTAGPLLFLSVARDHGMPEAEFIEERERWLRMANVQRASADSYTRAYPWIIAYAAPSFDDKRAREALAAMPDYEPIPPPSAHRGELQLLIARVFANAGLPERALPYLENGIRSCLILEDSFAMLYGYLLYAQVLDQLGRGEEGRPWLERVLAYWGNAQPASRHADRARAALAKLNP